MTETIDDTKALTVSLTGAEEQEPEPEPEKKTPWMVYLLLAGIAAALLG